MENNDDLFPDELLELAFVGGYKEGFPELAIIIEREDWSFKNTLVQRSNPILVNFITNTYKRLVAERKVVLSPDGQKLCFNTGLVTENQEEVFALFEPNRNLASSQKWFLTGWRKKSSYELTAFSKLPDLAQFFEDPAALVFDARRELRINYDHVIADNRERFPSNLATFDDFAIRNLLVGAMDAVKVRVRRNYKTAIPQFYRGRLQLLLPVCLSYPKVADLALVVERYEDHYRASTCLTLDMAYNNARLLARPDRDWLQP